MKTLLSAEWKERRLVFSSAAALALISNAASRLFAADYEFYAVLTGYYIIPVVFCFFLGAGAFGKKFSGSRKPLLEARPVPGPGIFLARFLSGMVVLATPALVSRLVFGIPFAVPALFSKPLELAGRPLYFFLLPAGVLYSAVCSGSGLFKNRFLAVVSPLVLLPLAVLLVLPLFAVFYLAHPPLFLPLLLASLSIMAALLAPGYAAWRSFAAGDGFPLKKIAVTAVLIGAFSFIVHGVFNLAAGRRMESALRRAAEAGLTAQLEELIPPPVPDEDNAALLYQEAFRAAGELKEKYPELWDYIPYISLTPWDELSAEKRGEVSGVMDEPGFLALFNLLEEAARMPACRFDVRYEDGLAVKLSHLASMRGLMRLSGVFRQQPQYQARLGTALMALSLEIYILENGYYPPSLLALTPGVIPELPADPFTGKPYIYRLEDDGFAVYSVGGSRTDHGGVHDLQRGLDDIVFRKGIPEEN